jgi:hypothetical protein
MAVDLRNLENLGSGGQLLHSLNTGFAAPNGDRKEHSAEGCHNLGIDFGVEDCTTCGPWTDLVSQWHINDEPDSMKGAVECSSSASLEATQTVVVACCEVLKAFSTDLGSFSFDLNLVPVID